MIREGQRLNHPELAKSAADESWPTVKWKIEEFGCKYQNHLWRRAVSLRLL